MGRVAAPSETTTIFERSFIMSENKTLDPELQEALKGIWDSLTDE